MGIDTAIEIDTNSLILDRSAKIFIEKIISAGIEIWLTNKNNKDK